MKKKIYWSLRIGKNVLNIIDILFYIVMFKCLKMDNYKFVNFWIKQNIYVGL